MADLLRVEALLAKKESSYGVDPTPGVTDAVRITSRLFPLLKVRHLFENRRDDVVSNSLIGPKRGLVKGALVDIEIPWEGKGKGSAYAASTDIEADPLLQACGMSVAVDTTGGSEKLTYTPADTGHAGCTLYAYAGGMLYIITGARGNWRWEIDAGMQCKMVFVMTGMLAANPTTVSVPSATYDSSLPPVAVGMAFALNPGSSYTPRMDTAKFDLGNGVEPIEDANGADGLAGVEIVTRINPQFTCHVEKALLSSYNPWTLLAAVTNHTVALTLGSAQYNRFKLSVTESYLSHVPDPGEYKTAKAGWDLTLDCKAFTLVAD